VNWEVEIHVGMGGIVSYAFDSFLTARFGRPGLVEESFLGDRVVGFVFSFLLHLVGKRRGEAFFFLLP